MAASKFKGMRNREAARYARWSAAIAVALCLAVFGIYLHRTAHGPTSEKSVRPVPAAVAQQSAGFNISRAIGSRTVFTVHASQATEFKDQNRSELENVDITIYGPRGDRNDSVHAGECSYEPKSGSIRCQGIVQIDLRNSRAKATKGKDELHLVTSNILFAHDSGRVSTQNPVMLNFPGGQGTGTGLVYEPQTENATLEKRVQLELQSPSKSNAAPVRITGSALEFLRSQNMMRMAGPVRVQQDARTLTSGALELRLDSGMRPSGVVATGRPELVADERRSMLVSADQIAAGFSAGSIEKFIADNNVRVDFGVHGGEDRLSAQHAQIVMTSSKRQTTVREVLAQGNVNIAMKSQRSQGNLSTESLRMELTPNASGWGERIIAAESLAPAKMAMTKGSETDVIDGERLSAVFGTNDKITELRGISGVRVERTVLSKPPERTTAEKLLATFDPDGNWRTIDETGNVILQQGTKHGAAGSATMTHATGEITLDGAASIDDSASHLQADEIQINQAGGELSARGNVVAFFANHNEQFRGKPQAHDVDISADQMRGFSSADSSKTTSRAKDGHAIFSGHARLWQGNDVLQAQTIEFWQGEQRAEARGDVLGELVEFVPNKRGTSLDGKKSAVNSSPVLWQVRAPQADYWGEAGKMEWSSGVETRSSEETIRSQNIEMFLSRGASGSQLERAIATGRVRIEQDGRTGTADRGEYFAREGKFILSGGQPTLADSSGNTATGRQLTFFLANDTILIDSQNESRANHRAEK